MNTFDDFNYIIFTNGGKIYLSKSDCKILLINFLNNENDSIKKIESLDNDFYKNYIFDYDYSDNLNYSNSNLFISTTSYVKIDDFVLVEPWKNKLYNIDINYKLKENFYNSEQLNAFDVFYNYINDSKLTNDALNNLHKRSNSIFVLEEKNIIKIILITYKKYYGRSKIQKIKNEIINMDNNNFLEYLLNDNKLTDIIPIYMYNDWHETARLLSCKFDIDGLKYLNNNISNKIYNEINSLYKHYIKYYDNEILDIKSKLIEFIDNINYI